MLLEEALISLPSPKDALGVGFAAHALRTVRDCAFGMLCANFEFGNVDGFVKSQFSSLREHFGRTQDVSRLGRD